MHFRKTWLQIDLLKLEYITHNEQVYFAAHRHTAYRHNSPPKTCIPQDRKASRILKKNSYKSSATKPLTQSLQVNYNGDRSKIYTYKLESLQVR